MVSSPTTTSSIIIGFVTGSIVTLCATYIISSRWKTTTTKRNHLSSNNIDKSTAVIIPNELRNEQLSRHTLYFGKDGMKKLNDAKIIVVGLGGVGSHAVHMLARSGIGHIRMIDFDQISLSSLNRHACATFNDVGISKVTCIYQFLCKICSTNHVTLEPIVEMYTKETSEMLLKKPSEEDDDWTMIIDAIDDVPTKVLLLEQCLKRNIPVISCMGAGGKSDITRLHISDLKTASRDALASKIRQQLKQRAQSKDGQNVDLDFLTDMTKLSVVYSSEKTVEKLANFTKEQKDKPHDYGAVDGMRIRILPVLGTMPATMGMALAAHVLTTIANKPFIPMVCERIGRNLRNRMLQHLRKREVELYRHYCVDDADKETTTTTEKQPKQPVPPQDGQIITINDNDSTTNKQIWIGLPQVDNDDIEYLLDFWYSRCCITTDRLGQVLEFIRWDITKPCDFTNLILISQKALKKLNKENKNPELVGLKECSSTVLPSDIRKRIETRLSQQHQLDARTSAR